MKLLSPSSEAELAELVSSTSEPLRVMGGGTRPIGVPVNAQPLTTQKISGIALYEPGALTLVAKAGTTVAEIEKALAKENQRLAFEPMDHRGLLGTKGEPTIGGVFAANVSGPRRIQCGAARDFLLGVRFVDGQGQITRNGGRVMKNVTGYDIVKLMAGSYGTLGVLTEVALKVLPRSNVTGTLKLAGLTDEQAIGALSAALGSPYEVTGAAHMPKGDDNAPQTLIRIEGFENSVKYRAGELFKKLGHLGEVKLELEQDINTKIWQNIRDVGAFHGRDGDVWRLSVKPSDAPDIVAQVGPEDVVFDWGGGLIWLLMPQDTGAEVIRSAVADKGGHATLIRGNRAAGAFHPLSAPVAALQNGLRARFDPKGVLNPGLMGQAA